MAIAYVNSATGVNNSGTTATTIATSSFSLTAGNFLFVLVKHGTDFTSAATVTDTEGNTFTRIGSLQGNSPNLGASEIFYAANVTGNASNVVTATWSSAVAYREISVVQYSGIATASPIDAHPTDVVQTGGGYTSATSNQFSTSQASEVILCAINTYGVTYTAGTAGGSSMTLRSTNGGSGIEDLIVSSTQSNITASISWDSGSPYTLFVVSVKEASGTTYSSSLELTNATDLTGSVAKTLVATSTVTNTTSLTGSNVATFPRSATVTNATSLTGSSSAVFAAINAALSNATALTGAGAGTFPVLAAISAVTGLTTSYVYVPYSGTVYAVSAALTASSSLTAAQIATLVATATLSSSPTLTDSAIATLLSNAGVTVAVGLTGSSVGTFKSTADLADAIALDASSKATMLSGATITSASVLTASYPGGGVYAVTAGLSVTPNLTDSVSYSLVASLGLTAAALLSDSTIAQLVAQAGVSGQTDVSAGSRADLVDRIAISDVIVLLPTSAASMPVIIPITAEGEMACNGYIVTNNVINMTVTFIGRKPGTTFTVRGPGMSFTKS